MSTGVLRYVNAGHDVPLLIRRNPDEVLRLEQSGPVFGLQESPRYVEGVVQLRNGDRIAFTQGIVDALASQDGNRAESTLIELARDNRTSSAFSIANRVLAECGETRLDQSVFVACVDELRPFEFASAAMQTSTSYFGTKENS
jgi:serine phosphatase RsbU (regulator of sigma subunit)